MKQANNNSLPIQDNQKVINSEVESIKKLIYTIRGKQVMLDSDVAMLYHCETRGINQTVKRNIKRFPERFCFKLTENELLNLKSQNVISSLTKENSYGGRRTLPTVFTEQGIAMLSGLLKSEIAVQVSINIMDAFIKMRKFLAINGPIFERLTTVERNLIQQNEILSEHEKRFEKVFKVFNELQNKKEKEFLQKIFFDGQIYDAYSLIINIIKTAKVKILIIDNYIDDTILEILTKKNINVHVILVTSTKCNINKLDVNKFNKQYPRLEILKTDRFHDRFILIDNRDLYHCGASLKDLGKKCFAISKMNDKEYIEKLSKIVIIT